MKSSYDLSSDIDITNKILSRKKTGLFRHLKMASSFENNEIGSTEKFRIKVDVFYLDHFVNIKIYDWIFDLIQEKIPNTFEVICIYSPFEKDEKFKGFSPKKDDFFYILQTETASLPDVLVYNGKKMKR